MREIKIHMVVAQFSEGNSVIKSFSNPDRAAEFKEQLEVQDQINDQIFKVWRELEATVYSQVNHAVELKKLPPRPSVPTSRLPQEYIDECNRINDHNRQINIEAVRATHQKCAEAKLEVLPVMLKERNLPHDDASITKALELLEEPYGYSIECGTMILEDDE